MDLFKPITLEDKALFNGIFSAIKPIASELTFPYLYMWRRDYNLRYAVIEDHLCMISQSRMYLPFAFCPYPVSGVGNTEKFRKALETLESWFNEKGYSMLFGRVQENCLEKFRQVYGDRMQTEYLESASDYVYCTSDLINLSGKKYNGKRNHISQFMRRYVSYEYVPVDESNLDECRRIMDEWCDKYEKDRHPDNSERQACGELLDNWDEFNLTGALIKVNGSFEAFTVGELLNPEMAVIRIEKGNTKIHGIYAVINREFCARQWNNMKYINREEDMGIPGLRKSKQSYNPAFMVRKFLVKVTH